MAAVLGGYYFAFLVAAAATGMFYEWMRIVRGWAFIGQSAVSSTACCLHSPFSGSATGAAIRAYRCCCGFSL
ncbi:hypothetical protein [Sphingomonas sediminicola]|uniref:hypothetical protein n=1 Tax=Sphingomonas sediminicola TaxID=386874 RepID=UPI0031B568FB